MNRMREIGGGRPRLVVSLLATVDGRITLNRNERLLNEQANARWTAAFPSDAGDLLAQRAAWIEEHHHPTVVMEGSG